MTLRELLSKVLGHDKQIAALTKRIEALESRPAQVQVWRYPQQLWPQQGYYLPEPSNIWGGTANVPHRWYQ